MWKESKYQTMDYKRELCSYFLSFLGHTMFFSDFTFEFILQCFGTALQTEITITNSVEALFELLLLEIKSLTTT